ncbi:MAG: DUF6252 family protein [Bacteroidia bacterium]|nr:DUF6252 family protein [Bacteroidia bacterium]
MKTPILLMAVLLVLLLSACKIFGPVEPSLPPETQRGADTFGALVDGAVWRPQGSIYTIVLSASYGNGTLYLNAHNRDSETSFGFELYEIYKFEKTYELVHDPYKPEGRSYINYTINNTQYNPTYIHKGYLTITKLDTTEIGFVSGTFYFDAVNENDSTDIIHITEGRFDVRF